ncbi:TetR/AcrR family transcriptional regulator [Candidatus Leptofilum sp.]|uniref:TetR/AcrR family transcriptional regulator n=1 Tax=Candidatus Leptofilum sp. TaxID=3241576 RepID=UPI003B598E40
MPKIVEEEKIYRAAIMTVTERGYGRATTKQIAEVAEISEVTLFRKYGNKAQLVKQAIVSMVKQIDFASATAYTGDAEADMLRIAQMYQDSADKHGQFFYIMLSEIPRHPELGELMGAPLHMINSVSNLLLRYQQEGILEKEDPYHAVAGLLGPLIATNMIRNASVLASLPPIDLPKHIAHFLNGRLQSK